MAKNFVIPIIGGEFAQNNLIQISFGYTDETVSHDKICKLLEWYYMKEPNEYNSYNSYLHEAITHCPKCTYTKIELKEHHLIFNSSNFFECLYCDFKTPHIEENKPSDDLLDELFGYYLEKQMYIAEVKKYEQDSAGILSRLPGGQC